MIATIRQVRTFDRACQVLMVKQLTITLVF